jgi:hypothetical protein
MLRGRGAKLGVIINTSCYCSIIISGDAAAFYRSYDEFFAEPLALLGAAFGYRSGAGFGKSGKKKTEGWRIAVFPLAGYSQINNDRRGVYVTENSHFNHDRGASFLRRGNLVRPE